MICMPQTTMYYVAGSPQSYQAWNASDTGNYSLVPPPYDQGSCATCVGHAVASAVQISLGYAIARWDQAQPFKLARWSVSPGSVYYCSQGGRTCNTGWTIPQALQVGYTQGHLYPKKDAL
jgi:hypothetical protein